MVIIPQVLVDGDTWTALQFLLRNDITGQPIDLTGCTAYIRWSIDGHLTVTKTASVTLAANGQGQYQFQSGDLKCYAVSPATSTMAGEVYATNSGGQTVTSEQFQATIRAHL